MEPGAQAALDRLVRTAHEQPPMIKDALHGEFHSNPEQRPVGEKISWKLFGIYFEDFMEESRISNPKTAADLLEITLQLAWSQSHFLFEQLRDFMDLVHFVEVYRTVDPPLGSLFYRRFLN